MRMLVPSTSTGRSAAGAVVEPDAGLSVVASSLMVEASAIEVPARSGLNPVARASPCRETAHPITILGGGAVRAAPRDLRAAALRTASPARPPDGGTPAATRAAPG